MKMIVEDSIKKDVDTLAEQIEGLYNLFHKPQGLQNCYTAVLEGMARTARKLQEALDVAPTVK